MIDDRVKINLIGGGFSHSLSSSGFEPKYIKWVKGVETEEISIYVDLSIRKRINPNTKNYGWLSESKTINTNLYTWCANNIQYLESNFTHVFTHDTSLPLISNIFVLVQTSGKSFIESGKIYEKTKLISMVASNKRVCKEHIYRLEIIEKYRNKLDLFGVGFNPIVNKVDGIKDYYFSIAMENGTYSNMFSEKITDCFMTGTIPIYYGIDNIGDFFNSDGIITLTDNFKIEDLSKELYYSKIDAIKENFKIANEMLTAEDYIFKNYIENEI